MLGTIGGIVCLVVAVLLGIALFGVRTQLKTAKYVEENLYRRSERITPAMGVTAKTIREMGGVATVTRLSRIAWAVTAAFAIGGIYLLT